MGFLGSETSLLLIMGESAGEARCLPYAGFFLNKMVKLLGGESVIEGAYPVYLFEFLYIFLTF